MATIDKTRLSEGMRADLLEYEKTKEDAIYWLGTGAAKTTDQIITRFQSSRIVDVALSGLKTVADWSNSNVALRRVRNSTPAMSVNNKYSSFALVENSSNMGSLRYPLCNSFAAKNILFTKKEFPMYKELVQRIQSAYNVKIVEQTSKDKLFSYKRKGQFRAKLKNAGLGVVNLCRTIFKKDKFAVEPSYRGKMVINNNYTYGNGAAYQVSQHEKFTRILDGILGVTVQNQAKRNKVKLSQNEMFASRLFAEILLSRAINYGDIDSNQKVETSLTLQLSNVLAALDLSPEKLQTVSKLGIDSALNAINRLGLSIEDVKNSVKNAGYLYAKEPQTMQEALLPKGGAAKEVTPLEEDNNNNNNNEPPITQEPPKVSNLKPLQGVLNQKTMLSKLSAKRYIDRVIESSFKKIIDSSVGEIANVQVKGGKKEKRLERQYNFVEHMLAYYNKNKDLDQETLVQNIQKELGGDVVDDNKYAHSLGQSFVELRNYILEEIFKGEKSIEKVEGKGIATVVNEFMQEKYGKQLASYTTNSLKKSFVPVFKEIDTNTFTPKKLVVEEQQR